MNKKISVLVVDDEKHFWSILDDNLRSNGFKVYLAEDGPTGLELAQKKKPDMILLDWMMPGMDGLQVLEKLKAEQSTEKIPVIMLTTKRMVNDVGNALLGGADGYILKPFEIEKLAKVVRGKLKKLVRN